jgi:aldose 1-epimerase
MTWGAVLRDLTVPHKGGQQRVVLGFPNFEDYPAHSPNFGAIAGRYANRIAYGRLVIDGETYQLPLNNGRHSLHGGAKGFGKRPWAVVSHTTNAVTLALRSEAGDAGYPGAVTVLCTYTLAEPATLRVELRATTHAPTVVNMAHHS